MRGAVSSSFVLNTIASLRKGPIRCNGIDAIAPLSRRLAAHARRQPDRVAGLTGALRHAQARPAVRFFEHQDLTREDQVRVADLVEVHAPQLGPAPRALQEQLGDVPQRVAAAARCANRARSGASSESGTPACATCCAVVRCCGCDREVRFGGDRGDGRAAEQGGSGALDGRLAEAGEARTNAHEGAPGNTRGARRVPQSCLSCGDRIRRCSL